MNWIYTMCLYALPLVVWPYHFIISDAGPAESRISKVALAEVSSVKSRQKLPFNYQARIALSLESWWFNMSNTDLLISLEWERESFNFQFRFPLHTNVQMHDHSTYKCAIAFVLGLKPSPHAHKCLASFSTPSTLHPTATDTCGAAQHFDWRKYREESHGIYKNGKFSVAAAALWKW